MKEIKFRAWDKGKGFFVALDFAAEIDSPVIKNLNPERFELMQYTGLKDKNGKEIYEGDVVVYSDTYSDYVDVGVGEMKVAETTENSLAEVIFQEGTFGLVCPKGSETLRQGFKSFWWITNEYGFELSELEVVGNIYENPDYIN